MSVFIVGINPDGEAARDGRLQVGMSIDRGNSQRGDGSGLTLSVIFDLLEPPAISNHPGSIINIKEDL